MSIALGILIYIDIPLSVFRFSQIISENEGKMPPSVSN